SRIRSELLDRGRELNWHPAHMRGRYENWVEGLAGDWLISRQRFFGVPFPVWYPLDAAGSPLYSSPIVPLNTRFKGAEARYVLERADVKLLFTVTDFLDTNYEKLLRAEPALPELREIIDIRGAAWGEFLARGPDAVTLPNVTGDDLVGVLFTSGTTGNPKGAMLTHSATVRAYDAWSTVVGLRA
ncbi:hypothetical protein B4Q13_22905, partial [Lacticaseibacillus rhamnosus]